VAQGGASASFAFGVDGPDSGGQRRPGYDRIEITQEPVAAGDVAFGSVFLVGEGGLCEHGGPHGVIPVSKHQKLALSSFESDFFQRFSNSK